MQEFKNIIIGFGKGGKTLAKNLAAKGESVLVIEKSKKMYGGTCINIACLPSKNLIINAQRGIKFEDAVKQKNEMTTALRNKNYHMVADKETATVLDGTAKFVGNHTIEIVLDSGEKTKIKGERIFINTGATPIIPQVKGLKESKYILDSTAAMDQNSLPNELVILGAGYIGMEFASMFARYGAKVTVLDTNEKFLKREDDDISEMLFNDLSQDGIEFKLGAKVVEVKDLSDKVEIIYEINGKKQTVKADKLLVATGRKPVTEGLGLENTDIELDEHGAIKVDDYLRTTAENVWAIGDVKGGPQFTYISLDDFRIIFDQLYGKGERKVSDRNIIPYSVFITPALSRVGLNEVEAKNKGIEYKLFKLAATSIPKAKVIGNTRGMYKILVDPDTEEILGATIYGEESYEVINLIALAMKAKLPYTMLRDQIYTHPTMSEALNDVLKG
ncbi:pyridine nucleotide-disulfide oxidoreductase [Ligilactobacillus salivarius]|uniref:Pyridine nucleotide-disulfide oxidoreductase n=2 Tax=Ligilactobacillus salivarius TaxID=1624 RepID=C2EJG1_9LACO|nr:FAD-dependent oxidoreductase [Ligilactobacillus salivarius]ATP36906.1 pyridine nucleotide-disulfide oxidoreductase [Ligilactobacillus salivarius]EEJ73346.1 pyridine nucleotide-disulfide oxidoreductase [Ligilactobacillus salivarius DSM 20555 = ATCC 11741]KRM68464.1 pyridine nucleotide-disulfide oxidoreductase family protein [Ligilactobacillus salivarius DSM 20555 = ATCC 11741]MBE7938519.1 FAD-dependent oxidoreductase [Ligilactobacillus salivarius]MDG9755980.1 FAD-dependent oxidoreductase [Li